MNAKIEDARPPRRPRSPEQYEDMARWEPYKINMGYMTMCKDEEIFLPELRLYTIPEVPQDFGEVPWTPFQTPSFYTRAVQRFTYGTYEEKTCRAISPVHMGVMPPLTFSKDENNSLNRVPTDLGMDQYIGRQLQRAADPAKKEAGGVPQP